MEMIGCCRESFSEKAHFVVRVKSPSRFRFRLREAPMRDIPHAPPYKYGKVLPQLAKSTTSFIHTYNEYL